VRELLHSVAIAVQRGGALSYFYGYERALSKMRAAHAAREAKTKASQRADERLDDESGEESACAA
jgi:hypothetical protein